MILVTGASGFVGSHLVKRLSAEGLSVRAIYNSHAPEQSSAALKGVEWVKADLLDVYDVADIMKGVTQVYHCAAVVSFQPRDQEKMLHFNPESTSNVVNEALEQGVSKFVYISSVAAIGRPEEVTKEITEEEEWGESRYNSAYGLSKYLAETEVWRGVGEGLNAVIVNPGVILGVGDWDSGSSALVKVAWKEFPFYTRGVTGWVDVADVVDILVTLMGSDITAERFIVSSGNYSYQEVFNLMAKAMHKKPPHIYAGKMLTGAIWRLGKWFKPGGKDPVITKETAANAHAVSCYSNQKLLKAIENFKYTPIEQTIHKMTAAFVDSMG